MWAQLLGSCCAWFAKEKGWTGRMGMGDEATRQVSLTSTNSLKIARLGLYPSGAW